ncbi:MAG: DUF4302 domain-containing protein [Bacteroidales bacterium]|nr:DUF4302 domain-containing protein [Bacteroidales bacterium]
MKNRKSLTILMLAVLVSAAAVSCVSDADPVFDKNATVRMQEALKNAQDVLVGAQYGWRMDDFMDEENTTAIKGGYTIAVKFDRERVTAWGEMVDNPATSYTSYYKMTTDDGPVLSFDDNNYVLHYYSTPSGTSYNGYGQTGCYKALGGDFEFLILEAKPEMVKLKGKRGGEIICLFPLDKEPAAFMANVKETGEEMVISRFENASQSISFDVDLDNRHIILNHFVPASEGTAAVDTKIVELPFVFTESGLRLSKSLKDALEKVKVEGMDQFIEFLRQNDTQDLAWSQSDRKLSFAGVSVDGILPAGWLSYSDYIGEYSLLYNETCTLSVKLERDVNRKSYKLSGMNANYTLTVNYDLATGSLQLRGQTIGSSGEYTYWFAPWALAAGGSLWYSTNYGMNSELDQASYDRDPAHFTIKWVPGPSSAGKPCDSFILYQRHSSGSGNSGITDTSWHFPQTNYRLAYLKSFTKK